MPDTAFQPGYLALLESGELERRVDAAYRRLGACDICPRRCGVDRRSGELGACRTGAEAVVASAGPHFGEEAPLVGRNGSGTVFFSGCSLNCTFCQNSDISQLGGGREVSAEALAAAIEQFPEAHFLQMARDIAATHHERFDGAGYPAGLVGGNIPLCGRVSALADVYDALTSKRAYKSAFTHEVSRGIILEESGFHFDPEIVEAFIQTEDEFIEIRKRFRDPSTETTASLARPVEA